jgi:hypothetical protein
VGGSRLAGEGVVKGVLLALRLEHYDPYGASSVREEKWIYGRNLRGKEREIERN